MGLGSELKSVFSKVVKALEKAFGSASTEQVVNGLLTILGPCVAAIVSYAATPAAGAATLAIIDQVETDYGVFCAIVQQGTPASGSSLSTTLSGVISSLKTNLSSLLTAADVKNSSVFSKIESEVTFFLTEISDAEQYFFPAQASSTAATAPASAETANEAEPQPAVVHAGGTVGPTASTPSTAATS